MFFQVFHSHRRRLFHSQPLFTMACHISIGSLFLKDATSFTILGGRQRGAYLENALAKNQTCATCKPLPRFPGLSVATAFWRFNSSKWPFLRSTRLTMGPYRNLRPEFAKKTSRPKRRGVIALFAPFLHLTRPPLPPKSMLFPCSCRGDRSPLLGALQPNIDLGGRGAEVFLANYGAEGRRFL